MDENITYYPLTHPQKGIWYTEKLYPGTSIGNVAGSLKLKGRINYGLLRQAYEIFVKKNDTLRLRFIEIDGVPYQYLSRYEYAPIEILDFSDSDINELYKWDTAQSQTPFQLFDSQLYYCAIFKISETEGGIYFNMHHLISDAWSIVITANKILEYYNKLLNDQYIGEEPEPSYIEYILNEKGYVESEKYLKDKDFWDLKMDAIPELLTLKAYSPNIIKTNTKRKTFVVPPKLSGKIREYCRENKVSVFALFISALSIYINRITGSNDIVLGVPVLNRSNAREKQAFGMFVSMVPLRMKLNDGSNFDELSNTVTSEWLSVLRHQKYPYDAVLKSVREKNKNVEKLYDIALSYQNAKFDKSEDFEYQEGRWHSNGHQTESLFIHINNRDEIDSIILDFDFLQCIFSQKEVEFIYDHVLRILWHAIDNPFKIISKIDMISEKEKNKILYDFNNTEMQYPSDKTISRLFEEQVPKSPDNIAAVFGTEKLTYRELNELSNQLARTLVSHGIGTNATVGIMLSRSLDILIGIFAVLKAGGAYLPIDPELPEDRIQFMLDDSDAAVIITESKAGNKYKYDGQIINIDDRIFLGNEKTNLLFTNKSTDLAYIMYTSGSTGKPKATMVEHRSVVNFAYSMREKLDYNYENTVLCITTMCFDIFVFEVFPTLIFGLKLIIANEDEQKIPELLARLITRNRISKVMTTPSRMNLLISGQKDMSCFSFIKEIILGGEPFPKYLLTNLNEVSDAKIYNLYGPTETTVYSTFKELSDTKNINIGRPIGNTQIYILDKNYNIAPIGVQGEIYIGGHGLARGYYHRDALTAEKFITNPFNPAERLYKTGDLGRWFAQGEIECQGRIDFQVKIRGYRVELGEIESHLLQYPGIEDATVVDKQDRYERKFLCAYIVSKYNHIDIHDLKSYLSSKLPNYMMPSVYMKIEKLPLNSNGKINRFALPEPEQRNEGKVIQPPRNDVEKLLVSIWSSMLQINIMGIDDNLFDLGADSLTIVNFQTVSAKYDWNLTTQDFYKYQTIRDLSNKIMGLISYDESEYSHHIDICPRDEKFLVTKVTINKIKPINNILLTGVTGYLGIHMLDYILSNTECQVYCIIRSKCRKSVTDRFESYDDFYFDGKYRNLIGKRIFLLSGDISCSRFDLSQKEYKQIGIKINAVINAAANVKYYGNYIDSYNSNVLGVKHCAEFCTTFGIPFYHISTLGVSGQYLVNNQLESSFTENDLFIGQNYMENVYVRSKFEAENLINSYMKTGLTATVYRVGNLTGRFSDGVFQQNSGDNAFVNLINSIVNIGLLPEELTNNMLEFTPVDLCSKAVIDLLMYEKTDNKVFHIFNHNRITAKKLITCLNENGHDIHIVDAYKFRKHIEDLLHDERRSFLTGLVNDLNSRNEIQLKPLVNINSDITLHYLNQIGFYWPDINSDYLVKFFSLLKANKAVLA